MIAALFYGFPGKKLTVIGVAGTKGKTSTAYFMSQLLDCAGITNCLFSTAALKIAGEESLNTLKLTTPTPFYLQSFLARAVKNKCTHAVLEVSSHAILQHRFWGVPLHTVVITNLMPDHLEYHATAEHYQKTHSKLLTKSLKTLILNADDHHLDFLREFPRTKNFSASSVLEKEISPTLIGTFTYANLSAAREATHAVGVSHDKLSACMPTLHAAPGRMEYIETHLPFRVLVDYAHSVDSLKSFFETLRPLCNGKIITVFGACGDRDATMRAPMGAVLDTYADSIIVTNDDPYLEDPTTIAVQLLAGITHKKEGETLLKILDRREAIRTAFSLARDGDIVCILGKGAEQWQIFKDKKIPWDDREVARELLHALSMSKRETTRLGNAR